MKAGISVLILSFFVISGSRVYCDVHSLDTPPRMPMRVNYSRSAWQRRLSKEVLESRLLDDMEDLNDWELFGDGELSLSSEYSCDGEHSVRLRVISKTLKDEPPENHRWYAKTSAFRNFREEDWTNYNRLSFWVRPHLPGWYTVNLRVRLHNEGEKKVPSIFYPVYHFFNLKNDAWNQVIWEIPDIPRDRIRALEFRRRRQSNEAGASRTMTFYIDHLELQRVEPDHYSGWDVADGRIAYSHTGYQAGSVKRAIAGDITDEYFTLIDNESGETVFRKELEDVTSRIGSFKVMDFSQFDRPGTYIIKAGELRTQPFPIDDNVWEDTIWKAINFFYCERCGTDIEGIHRYCHGDWQGVHEGRRIVINGGWHDAGDLSQGINNTSEAVYAMFELAEKLQSTGYSGDLADGLIEEGNWGLDWVMKNNFGDGYRVVWCVQGLWTNNIIGDNDDISCEAENDPRSNFNASATEALASRILRLRRPQRSHDCLLAAEKDWHFAVGAMSNGYDSSEVHVASKGVLSSVELYKATGKKKYAEKAFELAEVISACQQKEFLPGLAMPITGFFYTNRSKEEIQHHIIKGYEDAPIVALCKLCMTFPEHPDWIKWYHVVALHSEYFQKTMSLLTEPYGMLPNSLYRLSEVESFDERFEEVVREKITNGFQVGEGSFVRMFSISLKGLDYGNNATLLSQAKSVSTAARLRADMELSNLAQRQLHWFVGMNPFCQSLMYGEGYDYTELYSAMSGDIVGALSVGVKERENSDIPYWPMHNHPHHKEVWVLPVGRWIWLMKELSGPALVTGYTDPQRRCTVEFHNLKTGKTKKTYPLPSTGKFQAVLPQGSYRLRVGGFKRKLDLLGGQKRYVDLRRRRAMDFDVSFEQMDGERLKIKVRAHGGGGHEFEIRAENLTVSPPKQELSLEGSEAAELSWSGRIESANVPWVAVIIPDDNLAERKELIGTIRRFEK